MKRTAKSDIYYYAMLELGMQGQNLHAAKQELGALPKQPSPNPLVKTLMAAKMADMVKHEEYWLEELRKYAGDAAKELIEEMIEAGTEVGAEVNYLIDENSYFVVRLERENHLSYVGKFSRNR